MSDEQGRWQEVQVGPPDLRACGRKEQPEACDVFCVYFNSTINHTADRAPASESTNDAPHSDRNVCQNHVSHATGSSQRQNSIDREL